MREFGGVPVYRFGRLVGDNYLREPRAATAALLICKWCCARLGTPSRKNSKDCRIDDPAKPMQRISKRRGGGKPPEGSCPLQAGEASLNDAASPPTAVESGPRLSLPSCGYKRRNSNGCCAIRRHEKRLHGRADTRRIRRQRGAGSFAY